MNLRHFGLAVILGFALVTALVAALNMVWPANPPPANRLEPSPVPSAATPSTEPSIGAPVPPGRPTTSQPAPSSSKTREQTRPPVHRSTSPPPVRQTDPDVVPSYPNCHDLNLDHPEGVPTGHPAYKIEWDPDLDGWACDPT